MELTGRVAVVTGGASGIGRALALRFADAGARGVVVADLEAGAAEEVATSIGARAIGVGCDVTDDAQVAGLLRRAEDAFGPVDVFCANAGVGFGTGLDAPAEEWDRVMDVNVRAHVVAARQLIPAWAERGEGYWVTTASAAGLLTQIGDAAYSVTKHAAVAFAEWLSVTYGDRGVRVTCLCPMGVNTPLLRGETGLGQDALSARVVEAAGQVLEPEQVADCVVDAMRDERFLALPHPEALKFFQRKGTDYDRWLAGMRRLQADVSGPVSH
jgi:NAD(P)-dependent dehydrogenase (short-subunit alcohol dehydrogenase family)